MVEGEENNNDAVLIDEIAWDVQRLFFGFHNSLFDLKEKALKPLYRIEANDDNLRVIFDLPFVEKKEDLTVMATRETLSIEARMREPVSMIVGGSYQKRLEFDKYKKKIHLPVKVDPAKAKARFENGILLVEFALTSLAHSIKIA